MQEQNIRRRRRKKEEEARRRRDKAWSMTCLLLSSSCSEFVFQLSRELWILLFSQDGETQTMRLAVHSELQMFGS
jgi:hypothetical protein